MLLEQLGQVSINFVTDFPSFENMYEGFFSFVLQKGMFDP
jgi:hypothetical protein